MANILYSGTDFPQRGILVEESLHETLYCLQEAHWGLRDHTDSEIVAAIDWLRTRWSSPPRSWNGVARTMIVRGRARVAFPQGGIPAAPASSFPPARRPSTLL